MISGVLDSSALLAYLNRERGVDVVAAIMSNAVVSSVNLAEVVTKLVTRGETLDGARTALSVVQLQIIDFTRSLAEQAGGLVTRTRSKGLSLGDRACLALAQREGVPAFTADRAWASLDIGVEIRLIR
jgi:PIN domain nuclease of toxin-antitoxin system